RKRRLETVAAGAGRIASPGQHLQCATALAADLRKPAGRVPEYWRTAQGGAAQEIRVGPTHTPGQRRTDRRGAGVRRQGGGRVEGVFGSAVPNAKCQSPNSRKRSKFQEDLTADDADDADKKQKIRGIREIHG